MRPVRAIRRFGKDARGATAVEFALVSLPFLMMVLMILQIGIYYMAKSSLDGGLTKAAEKLINDFNAGTAPPTATTLKTTVVANSNGLIKNTTSLAVDLRLLTLLSAVVLPIVDGTVDVSTTNASGVTSILVLRAQVKIPVFAPGLGSLAYVRSSTIVRRQS